MNIPCKAVQPKAKRCKHVSSKENEPGDEFPGINEDSDEGIDFASEKALKGEKWDRMDESNEYEMVEVSSDSFKNSHFKYSNREMGQLHRKNCYRKGYTRWH